VTNLLLITDVPRLRKIFSRLSDEIDIKLRIANSLEKGGEEIVADKPAMVFVQTHLSGLSADILLMHLKKQLGRKRSRFVLLTPPGQAGEAVLKLYHGQLDISLDDDALFGAIREIISGLTVIGKKSSPATENQIASLPPQPEADTAGQVTEYKVPESTTGQQPDLAEQSVASAALALQQIPASEEPSLEEQGVTYAPRSRVSVYSEFTSSFESAVNSMQPNEPVAEPPAAPSHAWGHVEVETIEPAPARSKRATFILWLAPVLIAVVVVTIFQNKSSKPKPEKLSPQAPVVQPSVVDKQAPIIPAPAVGSAKPQPAPVIATAPKSGVQTSVSAPDAQMSDRAVLSAIAENRGQKEQAKGVAASARPTALPDIIPRSTLDKDYGKANPGWERYKGQVTEFKVFREGAAIKAIQVIDRGGEGVPESFMKAALRQVTKKPVFVMESSEKKDGYEIQRGRVAENLKVVYYRDEQGGRLRAFVMTWK
jgi:hypothetical protein